MYVYYGKCFLSAFDHKMKDCRPTCKVRLLWCRWSVPITRARCSSCLLGGALHTSRCYVPWCLGMRSPVTMAATSLETIMHIVNVKRVKGNLAFQLKLVISEFYFLLLLTDRALEPIGTKHHSIHHPAMAWCRAASTHLERQTRDERESSWAKWRQSHASPVR